MELFVFLRSVKEFSEFSDDEIKGLEAASEAVTFKNGEMIKHRGDTGRYLYIMYEGEAEVVLEDPPGSSRVIASLNRGEIFGEMSIVTGAPSMADILSSGESTVVRILRDAFSDVLMKNAKAIGRIAQTITKRLIQREKEGISTSQCRTHAAENPDPYDLDFTSAINPLKILVINCRAVSLKYALFDTLRNSPVAEGIVDRIGAGDANHRMVMEKDTIERAVSVQNIRDALGEVLSGLTRASLIKSTAEISAVGHRVVHGGHKMYNSVVITDEVLGAIKACIPLAPQHNPYNVEGIEELKKLLPGARHVAVFDTAFHRHIPEHASTYSLPENLGIRRFGFHGTNHHYVMLRAAMQMKQPMGRLKIISCHLGSGASVCAINHGRSIDTSMGMTPLEGLIMGTRSGDVDPGALIYLMKLGHTADELERILNRESGMKGISGVSGYVKDILEAAEKGDERAKRAVSAFCYRVKKYIGAYIAALGGLDVLVFTGGVGENSSEIRARICQGLEHFGIYLFDAANRTVKPGSKDVKDVSEPGARVRVLVVPSDEKRMIARETLHAIGRSKAEECNVSCWKKPIPVNVSAHHVHVNRDTFQELFGQGRELTARTPLSQPGQYAADQAVNLIGPKGRVERVRILGPYRKENQVEISRTEEFKLGIDAPVRDSGDIEGTPGITLEGSEGKVKIEKGVICARRHVHMSPEDALSFNLRDRDVVMVRIKGPRELIFGDVLIRVHPDYRLDMHIDTDEGNAVEHTAGTVGYIESIQSRAYM
jgi:acetate kinase